MNWDKIFNRRNNTKLSKLKKFYRSLKLKTNAKIISVVGTNGKGSVVSYLAQGLIKNNYKVGIFTSPHIFEPNERIKINNKNISNEEAFKIIEELPYHFNFFSIMFLTAMIYFIKNNVDVIILEAGIGGSYDSTNAVKANYGVVTSIGIDHTNVLGNNEISIANDKSGIINNNMKFFIPNDLKQNLKDVFINKVMLRKNASFKIIQNKANIYTKRNMLLAQGILKDVWNIEFDNFLIPKFRTQVVAKNNIKLIYDVGHNKSAFVEVVYQLNKFNIEFQDVVICLSKTKDKENIMKIFKNKNIYGYQLDNSFWSPKELGFKPIKNIETFKPKNNTLFIGSFYFISKLCKK